MSTAETEPDGLAPQVLADLDDVMKRISDAAVVDPETSRRIEERADGITAEGLRVPKSIPPKAAALAIALSPRR